MASSQAGVSDDHQMAGIVGEELRSRQDEIRPQVGIGSTAAWASARQASRSLSESSVVAAVRAGKSERVRVVIPLLFPRPAR